MLLRYRRDGSRLLLRLPRGLRRDPLEPEALPAEVCLGRAAVPPVNDLARLGQVEDEVVAHLHLGREALHDSVGLVRGEDTAGSQHVLGADGEAARLVACHRVEGLRVLKKKVTGAGGNKYF